MSHPLIDNRRGQFISKILFQRGKKIFNLSKILPLFKAYDINFNKFVSELLGKLIVRWKFSFTKMRQKISLYVSHQSNNVNIVVKLVGIIYRNMITVITICEIKLELAKFESVLRTRRQFNRPIKVDLTKELQFLDST